MEFFTNAYQWVLSNGGTIMSVLLGAHALALAIVNITPTPKDNAVVAKIYKYIEKLAGLLTKKSKEDGAAD